MRKKEGKRFSKKYSARSGKKYYPRSRTKYKKIKPALDPALEKVFADIGVPAKQPFKPDPFQLKAIEMIQVGDCLVTAPTGSGKTWIAQQAIAKIHAKGGHSWYTAPLKALSNAKFIEFCQIFGKDQVGILTGDRKENPDAPIIVGTTEILRNQLYDAMYRAKTLATDFVVLDEAHFLGDKQRGVVWEEIMIYLAPRIPLLMLSATIGNADQIADWLFTIRGNRCEVVRETKRPVPLFPLFFHPTGTLMPLVQPQKKGGPKKGSKEKLYKKVAEYLSSKPTLQFKTVRRLPPFDKIMRVLIKYNLLPVIFFLKSRADCDNALELCVENPISNPDRKETRSRYIEKFIKENTRLAKHRQLWLLEHLAIGAHHSGQLPSWKLLLEELMSKGLLDAVFATSTVAAGVNFPARTVAFLNSDRFNGVDFCPLNSTEFHQMTGRAGRRGMDQIGFGLALPDKFMDLRLIIKLIQSRPAPVLSQIKITFSMTLNLLLSHEPDQIKNLLDQSFATYLLKTKPISMKTGRKTKVSGNNNSGYLPHGYLWQSFTKHLDFLRETGFTDDQGQLTTDGFWASKLRIDHPLIIAQALRQSLLPENNPALLAAIIASFVNEKEPADPGLESFADKMVQGALLKIIRGLNKFNKLLAARGFEIKTFYLKPAIAIYHWASGSSWEKAISLADTAEGDLVMLIFRTVDNLRHMKALSNTFPLIAQNSALAIELIQREPAI